MNIAGILGDALEGEHVRIYKGLGDDSIQLGDMVIQDVEIDRDGSIIFYSSTGHLKVKASEDLRFERILVEVGGGKTD
jgi:hypothetical protein